MKFIILFLSCFLLSHSLLANEKMTAVFGSKIFKSSLKKAQTKNKVTCKDFVWTQGPCSGTTCSIYLTSPCSNNKRQVVGKIFMYFDIPFNDPTPESVHLDDFGFEKI